MSTVPACSSLITQWHQIKSLTTVTVKQPIQLLGEWSPQGHATYKTKTATVYKAKSLLAFFRIILGRGSRLSGWRDNEAEMLFEAEASSLRPLI